MTLVSKSHGFADSIINPIYGFGVKTTPDIYVGIERYFPDDSKNVSFVDMSLV